MIFIIGNLKPYNWWKYLKPYGFTYLQLYFLQIIINVPYSKAYASMQIICIKSCYFKL